MHRHVCALTIVVVSLLLGRAAVAAEPLPPRTAWIPQDAVLVVDLAQPRQVLEPLLDDRVISAVTASPQYQEAAAKPEFKQMAGVIKHYQDRYQTDFRGLCGKLFGGGVTWAIGPKETNLLIVDTEDARLLEDVHEFVRVLARGEAEKRGEPNAVASAEYRGVTGWKFGPNEAHAIIGNRLLLTNKPDWLKAAVDLRAEPNGTSVAKAANFRTAQQAVGANAVGSIYVDLAVLKQIPQVQAGLAKNNENPLASLLFAPLLAAVRQSNWLALGMRLQDQKLTFDLAMDSAASDASSPQEFAAPQTAQDGAMPNFAVPRQIAGVSFYRDLHKFYAAKDQLFPERTSGLIFFENMMGIFFTGRDLTDEVLAETTPHVRFVVAQQEYDPKLGTPQVQLPGFAAVFRMRNPDKFSPVAEEAFQKALGLINFTRGQKAEPGLILDRPEYGGVKYTVAAFGAPATSDQPLDIRFNFRPTLAMPNGYVVISSTEALARDLIDALKAEAAGNVQPLAGLHTVLTADGSRVASILNANRENMIQQSMVEKGKTHEQAAGEFDVLLKIAEAVRQVTLKMGSRSGQTHATFEMTVKVP